MILPERVLSSTLPADKFLKIGNACLPRSIFYAPASEFATSGPIVKPPVKR